MGLAAAGIALLAAAIGTILATRGEGAAKADGVAATMREAGCTFRQYKSQGRDHVNNPEANIKYNSFPPTSGTHYNTPAPWNIYSTPISQVQGVHNLEHGGILVQYGSGVAATTIDLLTEFVQDDPRGMLMAPLPRLRNRIALTAWRNLATCTKFDEKAFQTFRDAFRGNGPEKFPLDDMEPGE